MWVVVPRSGSWREAMTERTGIAGCADRSFMGWLWQHPAFPHSPGGQGIQNVPVDDSGFGHDRGWDFGCFALRDGSGGRSQGDLLWRDLYVLPWTGCEHLSRRQGILQLDHYPRSSSRTVDQRCVGSNFWNGALGCGVGSEDLHRVGYAGGRGGASDRWALYQLPYLLGQWISSCKGGCGEGKSPCSPELRYCGQRRSGGVGESERSVQLLHWKWYVLGLPD